MLAPGAPEFSAWFHRFQRSCFRLETLQRYGGSSEDASIREFLAGGSPVPHPGKQAWMKLVHAAIEAGRTMQRVHVVADPLGEYTTFEVAWSYAYNVAAGEDVRIVLLSAGQAWPYGIPRPGGDFWLFDDTVLMQMYYDPEGMWLGVEHVVDPVMVKAAHYYRSNALRYAQPWMSYINKRPELARLVPDVQWPH